MNNFTIDSSKLLYNNILKVSSYFTMEDGALVIFTMIDVAIVINASLSIIQ